MKQKIGCILGLLLIAGLMFSSPWSPERSSTDFTQIIHNWGHEQANTSDKFTLKVVSGAEGDLVGEHEIDGSNWAIPNIIRHWLGVK